MKLSRIIIGIQFMIHGTLVLGLLFRVRGDVLWSALGEWYWETIDMEYPLVIPMLMPFAPIAWWSWTTPVAFGIYVAARLRRPLDTSTLILSSLGTVAFSVVLIGVFLAYSLPFQYMSEATEFPFDLPSMIANLSLVALSVGMAAYAIICERAKRSSPSICEKTSN